MLVEAIADGWYGGSRRRAGSTFEVADGQTGKWFRPVSEGSKPRGRRKQRDEGPGTFSELANKESQDMGDETRM